MDFASIVGLILCVIVVVYGILSGQSNTGVILNFFDIPSIFITIGGSLCCVMIMSPSIRGFFENLSSIRFAIKTNTSSEEDAIKTIIRLSNIARKEGILSLEETANTIEDEFLRKGILLIVDGTDPELVRNILETELDCMEARHKSKIQFWESLSAMGPAWGMIGTLIGLINMLKKLDDVNSIGPNMAVALVTTFYGSILANWICIPIATKLKANNAHEIMIKEVILEGLLSIHDGENPRVIEEKLKSFLSPARRVGMKKEGGEDLD